jgi:hypothetical protein
VKKPKKKYDEEEDEDEGKVEKPKKTKSKSKSKSKAKAKEKNKKKKKDEYELDEKVKDKDDLDDETDDIEAGSGWINPASDKRSGKHGKHKRHKGDDAPEGKKRKKKKTKKAKVNDIVKKMEESLEKLEKTESAPPNVKNETEPKANRTEEMPESAAKNGTEKEVKANETQPITHDSNTTLNGTQPDASTEKSPVSTEPAKPHEEKTEVKINETAPNEPSPPKDEIKATEKAVTEGNPNAEVEKEGKALSVDAEHANAATKNETINTTVSMNQTKMQESENKTAEASGADPHVKGPETEKKVGESPAGDKQAKANGTETPDAPKVNEHDTAAGDNAKKTEPVVNVTKIPDAGSDGGQKDQPVPEVKKEEMKPEKVKDDRIEVKVAEPVKTEEKKVEPKAAEAAKNEKDEEKELAEHSLRLMEAEKRARLAKKKEEDEKNYEKIKGILAQLHEQTSANTKDLVDFGSLVAIYQRKLTEISGNMRILSEAREQQHKGAGKSGEHGSGGGDTVAGEVSINYKMAIFIFAAGFAVSGVFATCFLKGSGAKSGRAKRSGHQDHHPNHKRVEESGHRHVAVEDDEQFDPDN